MRLIELYESQGEVKFTRNMINLIVEGKVKPHEVSLKGLWEAMGRPRLTRDSGQVFKHAIQKDTELTEAVDSTMFPKITGALINKVVMDAYGLEYGVADQLVTTIPSAVKDDTLVGFTAQGALQEVGEGNSYEETGFGEKHHKIYNRKFGRIIALTEEAVKFDQTGQLIRRAQIVGEKMRAKHEQIIFEAICEKTSSGVTAAWRPGGTSTTLYSDTSTDPYSSATLDNLIADVLADETDLDSAFANWSAFKDEEGDPMSVNPDFILTGMGKATIARKLFAQGQSLITSNLAGNQWQGKFVPVASPYVDAVKGASPVKWFIGEFRKQFIYTEVFAPEVLSAKPGNEMEWLRDVVYAWKARFMGGCGAVTNRYVIYSAAGG